MHPSPIYPVSMADQVSGILRQRILHDELRAGTVLLESSLSLSLSQRFARYHARGGAYSLCERLLKRFSYRDRRRGTVVVGHSRGDVSPGRRLPGVRVSIFTRLPFICAAIRGSKPLTTTRIANCGEEWFWWTAAATIPEPYQSIASY